MIFLFAVVFGILLGYALRGRVSHLASLKLRALWLVLASLVIQFLIFPLFTPEPIIPFGTAVLHAVSYVLVFVWLVLNVRVRAISAIGGGAALNMVVVLANGGFMPASVAALRWAGLTGAAEILGRGEAYGNLVRMDATTRLNFLGDAIPLPHWIPFATAISAGDVLIAAGLVWLIVRGMRSPRG